MAHIQLVKQTSSGLLLPATPESCDFLYQIKIGEWIHADFKRVRNYAFHKRFFKLLQLGFDYWTPIGVNRPGFPGECFICELRLPDHRF